MKDFGQLIILLNDLLIFIFAIIQARCSLNTCASQIITQF